MFVRPLSPVAIAFLTAGLGLDLAPTGEATTDELGTDDPVSATQAEQADGAGGKQEKQKATASGY